MPVTGFWHAGVNVRDMDEALTFYRDGLGLVEEDALYLESRLAAPIVGVPVERIRVQFLGVPGSDVKVELHEYQGIERHPASSRPGDYGAGHFCLFVEDLETIYARLIELGHRTRGPVISIEEGPRAGARAVYAIDPDGYHVELYERAPEVTS